MLSWYAGRVKRDEVLPVCEWLIAQLAPACVRVQVAGSIRREAQDVKDIEIVVEPIYNGDSVGVKNPISPKLDRVLMGLIMSGAIEFDKVTKRAGPRYKKLMLIEQKISVDLFYADAENWGNTVTIRTGCSKYSEAVVTHALKVKFRQNEGRLWQVRGATLIPVACKTEEEYFNALGIKMPPPNMRTEEAAARLLGGYNYDGTKL